MRDSEALLDALVQKRAEMGLDVGSRGADFAVILRGGPDLFRRTGKVYDEIRGQFCNAEAHAFCVEWKLQKSCSASLARYGEATAHILAKGWVAKMQWCYDLALAEGPDFIFSDEVLPDFREDPELSLLYDTQVVGKDRVAAIRAIRPKR